jgi:predicted small secreted protein
VYKGGITRNTEGKREQFEFVADASTGTILELNAQND